MYWPITKMSYVTLQPHKSWATSSTSLSERVRRKPCVCYSQWTKQFVNAPFVGYHANSFDHDNTPTNVARDLPIHSVGRLTTVARPRFANASVHVLSIVLIFSSS